MLFAYRHHVVRDLAWAISSPPLLNLEQAPCRWYRDEWFQGLPMSPEWLQRLDEAPEELQEKLDTQKDRRLGRYFETLWAFWLEKCSRFEVIAQSLPLRDGGKTLGELDFLVLDKASGKCLHWEVAVKFYLGLGNTREHANWHGPGKKDRLDLKVDHLLNRQSIICRRPEVRQLLQEMGHHVDACGVILKGRLFYPYADRESGLMPVEANPRHLRSYWLTMSELMKNHHVKHISPLVGFGWMAQAELKHELSWLNPSELLEAINKGEVRLPLYVSSKREGGNSERFFIVADGWAEGLMK